jgi:hypothetical protein
MAELHALLHFVMFVVAVVIREKRLLPPNNGPISHQSVELSGGIDP